MIQRLMRWIPLGDTIDAMPNVTGLYILAKNNGETAVLRFQHPQSEGHPTFSLNYPNGRWSINGFERDLTAYTHWMAMPDAPCPYELEARPENTYYNLVSPGTDGATLTAGDDPNDVLEYIMADLSVQRWDEEPKMPITITRVHMTKEQFEALPDLF